jgi:hypothetical protein
MEYDGMSKGHGKPKWKTLMIFNDAICVQAKGGEDSNVEGMSTSKVDDCLWGASCLMMC